MNIGSILCNLSNDLKRTVNKLIKTHKKLAQCDNAITFNGLCLKEDLLPTFSNVKLSDPATRKEAFTKEFRRKLVQHELRKKECLSFELREKLTRLEEKLNSSDIDEDFKRQLRVAVDEKVENFNHAGKVKLAKKLSKIYGGNISVPKEKQGYINLSSAELTTEQHNFLNLGLNCHLQSKRKLIDKKAELELLYQDILQLEKEDKVSITGDLKGELIGEGNKLRGNSNSQLLTKELKEAAKQLKEDQRIIIRRADKSPIFVILDREEYVSKLNSILSDTSKFQRIKEDPTKKLKAKVNRTIKSANSLSGGVHFQTIVGEFAPGYAYGTVKTHKRDNPLRPIISQVSTATYKLAKRLNQLLKPYIPGNYLLNSAEEFLDILRAKKPEGILASIDVVSLFTNVPVKETIEIILNEVYEKRSNGLSPLNLSKHLLERLLTSCTKDAPFRGPDGKLYLQREGVAMGSPLGPLFANFYMAHLENLVLSDPELTPSTYVRFVDDCFVDVRDTEHLLKLIRAFESKSVLRFTYELSQDNVIPFLDVVVERGNDRFITSVYRKPTNTGQTLNADSECPTRYKNSVIRAFVRRAIRTCSTFDLMHQEFTRVKQLLANNGYRNKDVDNEIKRQLDQYYSKPTSTTQTGTTHHLYYRNFMNTEYKRDKRTLKHVVMKNVKCKEDTHKLKLHVYYQSTKTKHLIMRNNPTETKQLMRTNVLYKFDCPSEDCRLRHNSYVWFHLDHFVTKTHDAQTTRSHQDTHGRSSQHNTNTSTSC